MISKIRSFVANYSAKRCSTLCAFIPGGIFFSAGMLILLLQSPATKRDMAVVSGKEDTEIVPGHDGQVYVHYNAVFDLRYPSLNETYCVLKKDCGSVSDANDYVEDHPPGSLLGVYVSKSGCYTSEDLDHVDEFGGFLASIGCILILAGFISWLASPYDSPIEGDAPQEGVKSEPAVDCWICSRTDLTGENVILRSQVVPKLDENIFWPILGSSLVIVLTQSVSLALNANEFNNSDPGPGRIDWFLLFIIIIQSSALLLKISEFVNLRRRSRAIDMRTIETMCIRGTLLNVLKIVVNILSIAAVPSDYLATIGWNVFCIFLILAAQPILTVHVAVVMILYLLNGSLLCFGFRLQHNFYEMYRTYRSWWSRDGPWCPAEVDEKTAKALAAVAVEPTKEMLKAMLKTHLVNCLFFEVKLYKKDDEMMGMFEKAERIYALGEMRQPLSSGSGNREMLLPEGPGEREDIQRSRRMLYML